MDDRAVTTIPLFSTLRRRERRAVARLADTVDVPAGMALTREGDLAGEFFVIVDGEATASRGGVRVATLGPGDFFGELGLLDGPRRTATVTATTPMGLLVVAAREFRSMLDAFPTVRERVERAAATRLAA